MKKWIIIVIIAIISAIVIGVMYLQLPFAPSMAITFNGKTYQPNISFCDWRTNSYDSKKVTTYWDMLENKEPLFVTKSWEVVKISTSSRMGLKTMPSSDTDKFFIQAIGNGHNLKDMYQIPEKEMREMTIVKFTEKDFTIDLRAFDQGVYDYSVSARYNAGTCNYYFKIKVE